MGSGTSREPLLDSPLGYILRNWKILTLQKAWSQYKLGNPPPKKAFAKSGEKTQNFLYVESFMALSQNPDLRDSGHMCLSVASLSPVPLCLSPSDFLDEPYLTFRIHMTSRKEF